MQNHIISQDNLYNKLTTQYAFWVICILPLFFMPFGFPNPFYLPKLILWTISFLVIAFMLFLAKLKLKSPVFFMSNQTKEQKRILFILFLYAVSWCISSIFSIDKVASLTGIYTFNGLPQLIMGIATFLLISNHYCFQNKHMVYVATTYTIVSVLSLLQFYRIDPLRSIYGEEVKQFGEQTFSTIGNSNQVATCLCVAYVITAVYFITSNNGQRWNRVLLVSVLIIFAGNVATYSKAGLIAAGVTLLITFPFIMKNRLFTKRYLQILVCSIIIYIVMNISSNSVLINRILEMFFEAFDITRGNVQSDYGSNRIQIWMNSIELIKNYWIVGSGPDTFIQVYDLSGFNTVNPNMGKNFVVSPHNESLRLIITTGIASLIFYWILLISVFKKGFQKINEDKIMMPFIMGLLCYEIKLIFNCSAINDIIIFWVLLAIVFNRATYNIKTNTNPR